MRRTRLEEKIPPKNYSFFRGAIAYILSLHPFSSAHFIKSCDNNSFERIHSSNENIALCGAIIKVNKDNGLSTFVDQIIIGKTLKNKVPSEKFFIVK